MKLLNIPDSHLGLKRFEERKDLADTFVRAMFNAFSFCIDEALRRKVDLVTCTGDLLNGVHESEATMYFLIQKLQQLQAADINVLLTGGNHDSVRSYNTVSSLDMLSALDNVTVVNHFAPELHYISGIRVAVFPHCKSVDLFQQYIKSWSNPADVAIMHASLQDYSSTNMNQNSMWIKPADLLGLLEHVPVVLAGHEHDPWSMLCSGGTQLIQVGATMQFSFADNNHSKVCQLIEDGHVTMLPIPSQLDFSSIEAQWAGKNDLATLLTDKIGTHDVRRIRVHDVPRESYSIAKMMADAAASSAAGKLQVELFRVDEMQLEEVGKQESGSFNLLAEFDEFAKAGNLDPDMAQELRTLLRDALAVVKEEDE